MRTILYAGLPFLFLLNACSTPEGSDDRGKANLNQESASPAFVTQVEDAHKRSEYFKKGMISFDIVIAFEGIVRLNSHVTLSTDSRMGRFDMVNGDGIIFNNGEVFYTEGEGPDSRARHTSKTWSYFFQFPYKLSDPGTLWTDYRDEGPLGESNLSKKLSFTQGDGRATDDWYIAYADKETKLLSAAAYIITNGVSVEEAEEDPHAIEYLNYFEVDSIPLAHSWIFWSWREGQGLVDTLGRAELRNFEFNDVDQSLFTVDPSLIQ